jgi:hypothetical protein
VAWLVLIPVASYASITNQTDKQGPVIVASGFPGISSQFILSFPFQQASDLLVLDYGQTGAVRDPAAVLVLGSDYTVSSGGYNAANQMTNGVVTLQVGVNNVIANDQIVIMRNVPLNQITSFTATGPLTIQQIEQALDKTATLSQQVNEVATGRALQFENFEVTGQNSLNAGANVLSLTNRKSTLLGFDPNGNPAFYPQATAGSLGLVTGVSTAQAVVQANSFVAGEPVTLSNTTWVAATANSTQLASNALGIVSSNGLSAAGFTVVNSGVCPVVGGTFTPGAIYYVPLSAGVVTSTAPSVAGQYVYAVATAESATVLVVGISTPSQVVAFPTLSGNNAWTGQNTFSTLTGFGGAVAAGVGINQTWTTVSGDFFHMTNTNVASSRAWAFGPGTGGNHLFSFYDSTGGQAVLELTDGAYGQNNQVIFPASGGISVVGNAILTGGASFNGANTGGTGQIWNSAANGLTLQGNTGSSNDFALKAQNGTVIFEVPTGTQGITFPGSGAVNLGSGTVQAQVLNLASTFTIGAGGTSGADIVFSGTTSSSPVGSIHADAANGLLFVGKTGSSYDFYLGNGAGSAVIRNATGTQNAEVVGGLIVDSTSTLTGNVTQTAKTVSYNGITTSGQGLPVVVAQANITGQSAAATITSYANAAADADFDVRAQMSVTASTTLVTTITCTYTDVANVSRSMIMPIQALTGTFVAAGAITGAGASIWETPTMHIRAKASTTITLLTSTGTFTGVTYSASGVITQLN